MPAINKNLKFHNSGKFMTKYCTITTEVCNVYTHKHTMITKFIGARATQSNPIFQPAMEW